MIYAIDTYHRVEAHMVDHCQTVQTHIVASIGLVVGVSVILSGSHPCVGDVK